ncbi:MAG: alpha-amylase family glycosyl hydrolase, partial [Gemmatimonadaceae bacterium]
MKEHASLGAARCHTNRSDDIGAKPVSRLQGPTRGQTVHSRHHCSALHSLVCGLALSVTAVLPAASQEPAAAVTRPRKSAADWWKSAVYYELYPRSFQDTNGDGIGDLNGITAKLDYLADLGVDAIWITPFFPSPQVDFGYDVSNYEGVDPQFGTLADFDRLLAEAHKRSMKVIADFVINHTSDQHPYFIESRSSRTNPKRDWYIWRDPKPGGGPPNNWSSIFGPTAWTLDQKTGQYYYHVFYQQQPDLNWRNPAVQRAMFNSVRFWLRRGVDGFRVDAIDLLMEDPKLTDNPVTNRLREGSRTEREQIMRFNDFRPENFDMFRRLRGVAEEFGPDRVLIGETYPPKVDDLRAYYGRNDDAFQLPFNFFILKADKLDASTFRQIVGETERVVRGRPTTYVLSNHDNVRAFDKFGDGRHNDEIAKQLALMLLTLRGAPFIYYGEEIGMKTTVPARLQDVRDPVGKVYWPKNKGRDGERTPMQWTGGRNAGFSSAARPWLPIPPTASTRNVEMESRDPRSVLSFYRRAIALRRASPALRDGSYTAIGNDPNVFAYRRRVAGQTMIVALNMSNAPRALDLDASDVGGQDVVLREAISNQRVVPRSTSL